MAPKLSDLLMAPKLFQMTISPIFLKDLNGAHPNLCILLWYLHFWLRSSLLIHLYCSNTLVPEIKPYWNQVDKSNFGEICHFWQGASRVTYSPTVAVRSHIFANPGVPGGLAAMRDEWWWKPLPNLTMIGVGLKAPILSFVKLEIPTTFSTPSTCLEITREEIFWKSSKMALRP